MMGDKRLSRKWQNRFCIMLENIDCDMYGFYNGYNHELANDRGGITTDKFIVRPYYWGDDEDQEDLPNFEYKDIKIWWYKYPLRSATINKNVSKMKFKKMMTYIEWLYRTKFKIAGAE